MLHLLTLLVASETTYLQSSTIVRPRTDIDRGKNSNWINHVVFTASQHFKWHNSSQYLSWHPYLEIGRAGQSLTMSQEGEKGNNSLLQRYSQNNHCTIIKRSNSSHLLVCWRSKSAFQPWQTIGRRQPPKATNVFPLPPLGKNSTHPPAFIVDYSMPLENENNMQLVDNTARLSTASTMARPPHPPNRCIDIGSFIPLKSGESAPRCQRYYNL